MLFVPSAEVKKSFPISIKKTDKETFTAECPLLPGCVSQGKTKKEAFQNISRAIELFLQNSASPAFDVVYQESSHPCLYSLREFNGKIFCCSNRDGVMFSQTGDPGSWKTILLTQATSQFFNPLKQKNSGKNKPKEPENAEDLTPQVYCLESGTLDGVPLLFAGTNSYGRVYSTKDGLSWNCLAETKQDRIHSLCHFRDKLYAASSTPGRILQFNGKSWSVVFETSEASCCSLAIFERALFCGTYPNGIIYRSYDAKTWEKVWQTDQSFVQAFHVFRDKIYAGTSNKVAGGAVFCSGNGKTWSSCFSSSEDINFFCFTSFNNTLYAGTGDKGKVYKTSNGEEWETAFTLPDDGVRSMAVYGRRLYVATENSGKLYKSGFSDSPSPVEMSEPLITKLTSCSATLNWTTTEPAPTIVQYGTSGLLDRMVTDQTDTYKHAVALGDLKSNTTYHYRLVSSLTGGSFQEVKEGSFTTKTPVLPKISSPNLLSADGWSNHRDFMFQWENSSEIDGHYYILDAFSDTIPDMEEAHFTKKNNHIFRDIADGVWYFHLRPKDTSGNMADTCCHYQIKVDTVAPIPVINSPSHPDQQEWYSHNQPQFTWATPHDLSGIEGYYLCLDKNRDTVPDERNSIWTTQTGFQFKNIEDGIWHMHVVAKDKANNLSEPAHYGVCIDLTVGQPTVSSLTHQDPKKWYSHNQPVVHWQSARSKSGIRGCFYQLNQQQDFDFKPSKGIWTNNQTINFGEKEDSVWYFHVMVQSQAGCVSPAVTLPVRIDTHVDTPKIYSPTHPDNLAWYTETKSVFEWDAPEDLSGIAGYYFAFDQNPQTIPHATTSVWTTGTSASFQDMNDGSWYFHLAAKDMADNVSEPAHYQINIDTVALAPTVTSMTHPSENDWSRQTEAVLTWLCPPDLSGIKGYYTCLDQEKDTVPDPATADFLEGTEIKFDNLSEGTWYFHITSADFAGNLSKLPFHYKIQISTSVTPPKIFSPTHPEPGQWYSETRPLLKWSEAVSLSSVVGYLYCWDSNPDTVPVEETSLWALKSEIQLTALRDGIWYFHLVSKDQAGNKSEVVHFRFNIDTQCQSASLLSDSHPDQGRWYSDPEIRMKWTMPEDLSGIKGFYYSLDNHPQTVPTQENGIFTPDTSATVRADKEGLYYFHLCAVDNTDNLSQASHHKVCLDLLAPHTTVHPLGNFQRSLAFTIQWSSNDNFSLVDYYDVQVKEGVNGTWQDWLTHTTLTSATFFGMDAFQYSFRARGRDKAGNQENFPEAEALVTTTIDVTPPPPVVNPKSVSLAEGYIELSWEKVSDPVSGTHFYRVYRSTEMGLTGDLISQDQKLTDEKFMDSPNNLEHGQTYYYTIHAVDKAGNEQTMGNKQAKALCDKYSTAPAVTSSTHPDQQKWYYEDTVVFNWTTPENKGGITGFYYALDAFPSTDPRPPMALWTKDTNLTLSNMKSGTWYLHLASKDITGNLSSTSHFKVNIDSNKPKVPIVFSPTHPLRNTWYAETDILFKWGCSASVGGIEGYYYKFDQNEKTVPSSNDGTWTLENSLFLSNVKEGKWYFHVVVVTSSGLTGEIAAHYPVFISKTPPPPEAQSPTHPNSLESYENDNPIFSWIAPNFKDGVNAYYYLLDQNPETIPTEQSTKTQLFNATFNNISEGNWYFHIVSYNPQQGIGKIASHVAIKIKQKYSIVCGRVLDEYGTKPVNQARIDLMQKGQLIRTINTNTNGQYFSGKILKGEYDLLVSIPNQPILKLSKVFVEAPVVNLNINRDIFAYYHPVENSVKFYYLALENGLVTIEISDLKGNKLDKIEGNVYPKEYSGLEWKCPVKLVAGTYHYRLSMHSLSGQTIRMPLQTFNV